MIQVGSIVRRPFNNRRMKVLALVTGEDNKGRAKPGVKAVGVEDLEKELRGDLCEIWNDGRKHKAHAYTYLMDEIVEVKE